MVCSRSSDEFDSSGPGSRLPTSGIAVGTEVVIIPSPILPTAFPLDNMYPNQSVETVVINNEINLDKAPTSMGSVIIVKLKELAPTNKMILDIITLGEQVIWSLSNSFHIPHDIVECYLGEKGIKETISFIRSSYVRFKTKALVKCPRCGYISYIDIQDRYCSNRDCEFDFKEKTTASFLKKHRKINAGIVFDA